MNLYSAVAGMEIGVLTLDVVVPTYNREGLLRRTLASLARAERPAGLEITAYVVDNNSPDSTAAMVQEAAATFPFPLRYVRETKQGLSHARNAGIAAGTGDLIAMIDDDEQAGERWFCVIAREFADPSVQFIGGPYLADWVSDVPDWLPPGYHAAIGAVPPKPRSPFGPAFGATLMGGNAVFRRTVFDRVGGYAVHLGRSSRGLLSDEDAELQGRIEEAGLQGMYVPDLEILHYIAPERLTRRYHRSWAYWRAVSQGFRDRTRPEPVSHLMGVPRYRVGRALRQLLAWPGNRVRALHGPAFSNELASWDLVGYIHGRFFFQPEKAYQDRAKSS